MSAAPTMPLVVFGDFICPWSFLVLDSVEQLTDEFQVRPWWRPHHLHPDTPPEGLPYPDPERVEATRSWLLEVEPERAARMVRQERVQSSRLAFEGLEFAEDHGRAWPYVRAVFDALWLEGRNISDPEVLHQAAEDAGLDGGELVEALRERRFTERMITSAAQTVRLGVTATPTLIIGKKRVNGWHYHEVLRTVAEEQHAGFSNG